MWKALLLTFLPFSLNGATALYTQHFFDIANPERGFTRYMDLSNGYTQANFSNFKNSGKYTVVGFIIGLDAWRSSPIPASLLTTLSTNLADARAAGIKMFLRFNYNSCAGCPDASEAWALSHLDQLAPLIQANADVICLVEAGFVGEWGEWHDSTNGLTAAMASRTTTGQVNIINKLLAVVPERRMIAMRYNFHKRAIFGEIPLSVGEAYQGNLIPRSRIGSHNDCLVSGPDDTGSYQGQPSIALQKSWLAQDDRWVQVAGETCLDNPPYDDCGNSLLELGNLGFSLLNHDYDPNVINHWGIGGCLAEVKRRLGYRFSLVDSTAPLSATAGAAISLTLNVANYGFSQPKNPRGFELVLVPAFAGASNMTITACAGPMPGDSSNSADPRYWLPGTTTTVTVSGVLPAGAPAGNYQAWLNLPDPEPQLKNRADYSIRLVSLDSLGVDIWDSGTGMNRLGHLIAVAGCAACTPTPTPSQTQAPAARPEFLACLGVPNPNPSMLRILMKGDAPRIHVRIYSGALSCVAVQTYEGPFHAGWQTLALDSSGFANGIYFAQADAPQCVSPVNSKILILR